MTNMTSMINATDLVLQIISKIIVTMNGRLWIMNISRYLNENVFAGNSTRLRDKCQPPRLK
jgi:hypothetical protein